MFTKYENGAEVEIDEVYRYESGAEVEADAVYAYKNGAEEEVWSNATYRFHQYGQNNATINGDGSVTMGFGWSAQSGGSANLVVEGVFEVGEEYTLTFTSDITHSDDHGSVGSTVKIGSTSQSYTVVNGSNTVTITPKASDSYLQFTISDGGQYSGSMTVTLTDIRINNRLVKKS
jgi:hypothetical protein